MTSQHSAGAFYPPLELKTEHDTHSPEPEKTEPLLALTEMLDRAAISKDRPRVIMKECQLSIGQESAHFLCRPANIRQRVRRIRAKKVDYGANPSSLNKIDIPDALRIAYGEANKRFLLCDNINTADRRILIFATPSNIQLLKPMATWYGDGTFAVCPELFYQLCFIPLISC